MGDQIVHERPLVRLWRRFDKHFAEVKAGGEWGSQESADAALSILDPIYDLWEAWRSVSLLSQKGQDAFVSGNIDGEITAALVYARGGKTHAVIAFGQEWGFGQQPWGMTPFGQSTWHWQRYDDPKFAQRAAWYAAHVEASTLLPPIEAAERWLRTRSELKV